MNSFSYCETKVAAHGGTLYYSLRQLPLKKRRSIIIVKAFYRELLDCLFDCQEVALARIRLQWWRDELDLSYQSKAQHPVAICLHELSQMVDKKLFLEMINGFESFLDSPLFEKHEDVFHFLSRTAGIREWICGQIIGQNQYKMEDFLQFGAGIEMIHHIRHMRRLIEKGFFFFSQKDLEQHGCPLDELAKMQMTASVQAFIQQQCQHAKAHLTKKIVLPYFRSYQKLMLILLNEIEIDQYRVLTHFTKLNPLRKLWVSWRS